MLQANKETAIQASPAGAGKAIKVQQTPSGIPPVQRYFKVPGSRFIQSTSGPGNPPLPQLMVQEGEPGIIYLRRGTPTPAPLVSLGITKEKSSQPDPLPLGLGGSSKPFKQLTQHRMPASFGKPRQGMRTPQEKASVEQRLGQQRSFLIQLQNYRQQIKEAMIPQFNQLALQALQVNLSNFIQQSYGLVGHSVIGALGDDIVQLVFSLYELAFSNAAPVVQAPPAAASNLAASIPECILLLDSLEQELEFRLKQLEREWNTRELKPVLPNDCGFSATDRGDRMFGKAVREKADFERAVFSQEIAWRIHFAHFDPPSPATANGYLEIRLNNDFFELQFGFTAQNMGAIITPAMQAFLIKNAVTVLDGLWAQEFAVEGFKRYDPRFQPGTQDSLSYTREINRRFTSPAHVLDKYALESL